MSPDILIIGGGAIGLSAAFRLARDGARVRLLEKSTLGAGASGSTAALLEFQTDTDRDPSLFRLAQISRGLFSIFEDEVRAVSGEGFSLELNGILQVALDDAEAGLLQAKVEGYRATGLRAEWLSKAQLAAAYPTLSLSFSGAALFGEDGQLNGDAFLTSVARAARTAGVEIIENAGDVTLTKCAGGVVACAAGGREWKADFFVVAAGAWSGAVLTPLGIGLPFNPVRGQLALYDSPAPDFPVPVCTSKGAYLAPKHSHLIVGATVEKVGFDASVTPDGRLALEKIASGFFPSATRLPLRRVIAGLRPGTPDLLPVMGFLRESKNVLVASGHYRNGMLLAPVTAQIVSDFVFHREPRMDLRPFHPDRFLVPEVC